MKLALAAALAAWALIGCGGGGGGGESAGAPVAEDPIDRYVGKWLRCDAVGSFAESWNVQTEWTVTKTGPAAGQLVVHEARTSACGTPPAPTAERKQIATGQINLMTGQQQAQGATWDRAGIRVQKVGDDCSPSPSVCSMFLHLVQLSGPSLQTSVPPVLSAPRLAPAADFTRGADGFPLAFEVTALTKECLTGCGTGGNVPATPDPIDRYAGTWVRCDLVGSAAMSWSVQTEWAFTRTSPTTAELLVHEVQTSACGGAPLPTVEPKRLATGMLQLVQGQRQAQGETWDRASMQARLVSDTCAGSPNTCSSSVPTLIQRSGNTIRTSAPVVLSTPRVEPSTAITFAADGYPARFEVNVLSRR